MTLLLTYLLESTIWGLGGAGGEESFYLHNYGGEGSFYLQICLNQLVRVWLIGW